MLALYLMTCPHSNMIGVFHCPILYMAHETGLSFEGASKALESLIEAGFCTFEGESETVFVHRMADFQVGSELKPADNRVKGVVSEWDNIASSSIKAAFHAMYSVAFHMPKLSANEGVNASPLQAPPKPRQDKTRQEQDKNTAASPDGFDSFWSAYPKKVGKPAAQKAFKAAKLNGHLPEVLSDISEKRESDAWTKNGGQFVPHPATYLNQRRWEDENDAENSSASSFAGML